MFIYILSTINNVSFHEDSLIILSVFTLYAMLICIFLPESPRWLLANNHKQAAVDALKSLRGPNFCIDDEINAIETDLLKYPKISTKIQFRELFCSSKVFSSLLLILVVMFLQQMSGLNANSAYATTIFREAGISNPSETASYAVGGVGICFTFFSIFIVDHLGRKCLLVISSVGMLLGTVMLGTHFYITRPSACNGTSPNDDGIIICHPNLAPLAITSLMLFNAAFSIGWGPVPWILLGELLPLRVRSLGSAMANFINWGSAAIVTGFYLKYSELVNSWFAWWTFSFFNFCGIFFVLFFLKETKRQILEHV